MKSKPAIPDEMEAKRNASGCRFAATGSYGDESSVSPPETERVIGNDLLPLSKYRKEIQSMMGLSRRCG